jgi:branched-chain amino acid transport system substrate-binding protein
VVSACSTGGQAASPTSTSGSKEPVIIGISGPLTGDNAEYGKIWKKGFDLALDEINAKGGIKGRPLQYQFEDTQSDPKQTPAVAQKFVANPKVLAVLGDFSSGASMAASPIYQRAGLVQMGFTNSHPDFTKTGDFIWSNSPSQQEDGPALAKLAVQKLGKKRLAVINMNTDWGKTTADLTAEAAKAMGAEIVFRDSYLANEKEFRSLLTKVRDAKPDALVMISYYNEGSLIAQQRKAVGLDVPVIAVSSVYSPQFIKLGGDAVEGIYTNVRFHPSDSRPEVQSFVTNFKAKFGEEPDNFSAGAYDGMKLLAQVIEENGFDRKAIQKGLAAKGKEFQTVMYGKTTWRDDRRPQNPTYVDLVVKNGKFEVVK